MQRQRPQVGFFGPRSWWHCNLTIVQLPFRLHFCISTVDSNWFNQSSLKHLLEAPFQKMCCPLQDLVQASKGKNQGLGLQHRVKPTTNISRKLITIMTGMLVNRGYLSYKKCIMCTNHSFSILKMPSLQCSSQKTQLVLWPLPCLLIWHLREQMDSRSPPLALHSCFKSHASPCSKPRKPNGLLWSYSFRTYPIPRSQRTTSLGAATDGCI